MASEGSDFYLRAAADAVDDTVAPGGSGYFSAPSPTLDPRLFTGEHFRPDVRSWILDTLYSYWSHRYTSPQRWSTVWAAGSGISYQWAADRGNGDLDVLIGVDFPRFWQSNPGYLGMSETEQADLFNEEFHAELWPKTAHWNGFEVTFYVNPGATDIRAIHPYAAYDLTHDSWTVRPPAVSAHPRADHPAEYWKAADAEIATAKDLISRFHSSRAEADAAAAGSPAWHNALAQVRSAASQASALFDAIHSGRRLAFGPGGSGYGDYYNFRWQAHKDAGTGEALKNIASGLTQADSSQSADLYGRRLATAEEVRTNAVLHAINYRSQR